MPPDATITALFDALDEWGRSLVEMHTCAIEQRDHRAKVAHESRKNLEMAFRHLMMDCHGPRRSPSVRMAAIRLEDDPDEG